MRIPLALTNVKTRTGAPNKDARLKNAYVEIKGDQGSVRKRPAATGASTVGTGTAQGGINNIVFVNDVPAIINPTAITLPSPAGGSFFINPWGGIVPATGGGSTFTVTEPMGFIGHTGDLGEFWFSYTQASCFWTVAPRYGVRSGTTITPPSPTPPSVPPNTHTETVVAKFCGGTLIYNVDMTYSLLTYSAGGAYVAAGQNPMAIIYASSFIPVGSSTAAIDAFMVSNGFPNPVPMVQFNWPAYPYTGPGTWLTGTTESVTNAGGGQTLLAMPVNVPGQGNTTAMWTGTQMATYSLSTTKDTYYTVTP